MISTNLQGVAELVIRQAQRQGFIVPRQVRKVLNGAGVSESLWKDVLSVARPSLAYRNGRYYYSAPISERVRDHEAQKANIRKAVQEIVRHHQSGIQSERRGEERIDFVQPVKIKTEDGREYTLLTRDLSATGIRLVGTRRFLGQKIQVSIPAGDGSATRDFVVRILWTCAIGDDLVENGGAFENLLTSATRSEPEA